MCDIGLSGVLAELSWRQISAGVICLGCISYGGGNRGNHAWSLSEEESKPITSDPDRAGSHSSR
jgi:hypothetical protein